MKRTSSLAILSCFFLISISVGANIEPTTPGKSQSNYSLDAIILTLRLQQGIFLDKSLAGRIEQALSKARTALDTLHSIHAYHLYAPYQLIVGSSAPWAEAWRQGNLITGFHPIDSINQVYNAVSVSSIIQGWPYFLLTYSEPLEMLRLSDEYLNIPDIHSTQPNYCYGDGDQIDAFYKDQTWHFAFSHGWGDCPAGCIYRHYWYVRVDEQMGVFLDGELHSPHRNPITHRWNIPSRYSATDFASVDDLIEKSTAADWWVRRHALYVIGRLSASPQNPWVGEDTRDRLSLFLQLRDEVLRRKSEIVQVLIRALSDEDVNVRNTAHEALCKALNLPQGSLAHYFPLEYGNWWEYDSQSTPFKETIIDTLRDQGMYKYYMFDRLRFIDSACVRFTDENTLILRRGQEEQVWLKFDAMPGETWEVHHPVYPSIRWSVALESRSDKVTVPAGTFSDVYRFHFKFFGADNDWEEFYAPGVGPIKRDLYGIGLIEYNLQRAKIGPDTIVNSIDEIEIASPLVCDVDQNYPNPFHDLTMIPLRVYNPAAVRLDVYDIMGRKISTLVDDVLQTGEYRFRFSSLGLPNGLYSYRLITGNRIVNKHMAIVR